jgi:hypothetical protein
LTKKICAGVVCILTALIFLVGCKDGTQLKSPRKKQAAEYDCRKHSEDKICEVPWKDKIVLYCYADKIPRVVRYREECK